jgi:hypothetical protein
MAGVAGMTSAELLGAKLSMKGENSLPYHKMATDHLCTVLCCSVLMVIDKGLIEHHIMKMYWEVEV